MSLIPKYRKEEFPAILVVGFAQLLFKRKYEK